MKKCLLIGCGGVGSNFIGELSEDYKRGQINDFIFYIADHDIVEAKNCIFQNFKDEDIGKNKAEVLSKQYKRFVAINKKITKKTQLHGYDLIICAADNTIIRKLMADYCYEKNIPFIDMRAYSRHAHVYSSELSRKEYLATLDTNDKKAGSCQDEKDSVVDKGYLKAVAEGSQFLIDFIKRETMKRYSIMN